MTRVFLLAYCLVATILFVSSLVSHTYGQQQIAPSMDDGKIWPPAFDPNLLGSPDGCATQPLVGKYRTFHVGPGQAHTELSTVPWLSLQGGDVVNIYFRNAPYKNWIGYRAVANATHPVTINGVTNANCNRPVITGAAAAPTNDAKATSYGQVIEGSGIVVIWKLPTDPYEHTPKFLSLRNLELSSAKEGNSYIGYDGQTHPYSKFVGGIYAIRIQHLLVHNCLIRNNGIGIFTNSKGQFGGDCSSYITVRGSKLYDSGYATSSTEHNLYLQARRVLVEGSYIGQANGGSSFKDRSGGSVIRYNYIHSSARALDLVETEEEYVQGVRADPMYPHAWVYGNVILNDANSNSYSARAIHWGYDNDSNHARLGTLYFYGNTFVYRSDGTQYYTNVFQLGNEYIPPNSDNFTITCWDNAFVNHNAMDSQTEFRLVTDFGRVIFKGNNYLPTGFKHTYGGRGIVETTSEDGSVVSKIMSGPATVIEGATFVPTLGSPLVGAGNSFTPDYSNIEMENPDFRKANLARVGEYHVPVGAIDAIAGARFKSNPQLNVGAY